MNTDFPWPKCEEFIMWHKHSDFCWPYVKIWHVNALWRVCCVTLCLPPADSATWTLWEVTKVQWVWWPPALLWETLHLSVPLSPDLAEHPPLPTVRCGGNVQGPKKLWNWWQIKKVWDYKSWFTVFYCLLRCYFIPYCVFSTTDNICSFCFIVNFV